MDPKGRDGDLDRTRSPRRSVIENGVEEDDAGLAGMVTDGFRPTQSSEDADLSTSSLASTSSTTLSPDGPSSPETTGRPLSTHKPQAPQYALSVSYDAAGITQQTTGSSSSTGFVPVDPGPYQGPTGPSHPYQLYSQNVRSARTLSMVTSSTSPPSESSYHGPAAPSHPYGLYPQGDGIDSAAAQPSAIPLGFRGLPHQYQRRPGPAGDGTGDIIGPDGYTEQLPPYTRYPDEAYVRKAVTVDDTPGLSSEQAATVPPINTTPASPVPDIPGAGGIGLATRNPEFESTDDLSSPRSGHSARSFTSDDSQRGIRAGNEQMSEKKREPKKWQVWMRRKLWGIIPYWAICLAAFVLVLMAVVLGAVIRTTAARRSKKPPRREGIWWV
jgi:hypothetical protein